MALHLVGETLDKARGHYRAGTGKLIPLYRGIYVDAGDDISTTVLKHAVRIAKYLYPKAYLSAASAVILGPTPNGRLFLSGPRKQRTRIRSLEIIQNQAPKHPSLATAVVKDELGELPVAVSSLRQRFLEAFRLRSEHAASIDESTREAIAKRLIEEYRTPRDAADAVWALARENGWHREAERAEQFLLHRPPPMALRNEAALDLIVAWHGEPIGHLRHDGFEWRWTPVERTGPTLVRQTTPGQLPPFILSLLPEGWLESVLRDKDERSALRSGKRYMSNITIVEHESDLAALPRDVLLTPLSQFSRNGVFTGTYAGPDRGDIDEGFEHNLAKIFESSETPRLSGIQIKAPMNLDEKGLLTPSTHTAFTHILKPAGGAGYEALPLIEWLALALGSAAGLDTPQSALIAMPDGMPPALLVERFDIRRGSNDTRMLALEDLCSVLDLPTSAKYDSTMERIVRAVRPVSTAPEEDVAIILLRAVFAWLIADGDMHLKNLALLKIAEPGNKAFSSIRMAPLYDAVTTRLFPGLKHDRMALKLNGKDDRLGAKDFRAFASTARLKANEADAVIESTLANVRQALDRISLPALAEYGPNGKRMTDQMLEIIRSRVTAFS